MFYSIAGMVRRKFAKSLVVETGNIGFLVHSAISDLSKINIGDKITMYTHFHVREDQISLVGFLDEENLDIFEKIISVSGIGIKAGIAILSILNPKEISEAIESGNPERFEGIPGIGKKTAQKIILELRGRVDFNKKEENSNKEAEEALIGLGFSKKEAREVLRKVSDNAIAIEEKIKEALKLLNSR